MNRTTKSRHVSMRITEDEYKLYQAEANLVDRAISSWIRLILRDFINSKHPGPGFGQDLNHTSEYRPGD